MIPKRPEREKNFHLPFFLFTWILINVQVVVAQKDNDSEKPWQIPSQHGFILTLLNY